MATATLCCYAEGVYELYPADEMLQDMSVEGYMGMSLRDGRGNPFGLIAIMSKSPLQNVALAEMLLQIIGTRASHELERIRNERVIRDNEALMREVLDSVSDIVWSVDVATGKLIYVSKAFERVCGVSVDDLTTTTSIWRDVTHDADLSILRQNEKKLMRDGHARWEHRIVTADGDIRWLENRARMVKDDHEHSRIFGVASDITERQRTTEIEAERERLTENVKREQAQNALVQRTISALSHDLRVPLSVVSTSTDLLQRYFEKMTPEKRQEKFDKIDSQLRFAIELIEDTVQVVRGTLHDRAFRPSPMSLATLCRACIDEVRSAFKTDHEMTLIDHREVDVVSIDEVLVSRIVLNLLSNAIKYSPNSTNIQVELERRDEQIIITVIDEGIGVSDEDLARIFEPFFRAENSLQIDGTGLGLSIVKDCVERHRGDITVTSTLGQGSSFTVRLPLRESPAT